jgi:transposase
VVIWDNVKPHECDEAVEAVEAAGARVLPLPPWSPDMAPIEELFSKVKGILRSAGTDHENRATIDREDGATRGVPVRLPKISAYRHAARHAVKSAE